MFNNKEKNFKQVYTVVLILVIVEREIIHTKQWRLIVLLLGGAENQKYLKNPQFGFFNKFSKIKCQNYNKLYANKRLV